MAKQTAAFNVWTANLGSLMRSYRALHGVSLRQYAKRLKISPATLSRIENGFGCDVATVLQIHEVTAISIHSLMCGVPGVSQGKETSK